MRLRIADSNIAPEQDLPVLGGCRPQAPPSSPSGSRAGGPPAAAGCCASRRQRHFGTFAAGWRFPQSAFILHLHALAGPRPGSAARGMGGTMLVPETDDAVSGGSRLT